MYSKEARDQAIALRQAGKSYQEITTAIGKYVPKATLAYWFRNIKMSSEYEQRRVEETFSNLKKGRENALLMRKGKRLNYLEQIVLKNQNLKDIIQSQDVQRVMLAILYLGEGGKRIQKSCLVFGNASPDVISLFLRLLRACYEIDESKFRGTLLCRADQNIEDLEQFWSKTTRIPRKQFYKARIDARTVGHPTQKISYKGVCRIEYFSSKIFHDILLINKIIMQGMIGAKIDMSEFFSNY